MASKRRPQLPGRNPTHRCLAVSFIVMSSMWSCTVAQVVAPSPTTNPVDLQVLHEMMYSMHYEYDWSTNVPDPCVSGPQGILCEPDPATGLLFVTQMQFGFISPIANIIPCSANATIPSSIAKLTRLTTLSFYSCFTNQPATLPHEITLLGPTLRLLSFSQNPSLTGRVPIGIGNLTGLQRLVLSQNALQGPIPEEVGALPALTQLDLSHNNFSGSIPASLGSMTGLVNLDLRYNKLSGAFPLSFCQGMPHLQRLALSYNKLSGSFPDAFTGLRSVTFMDLSSNELTGALPPSLGALSHLEDLFLNSNHLGSAIPDSLSSLTSLVRLDLSSCAFVGTIPDSLQRLANLRFLSVSNNRLSGPIPGSLASLPVLFSLNLDGNELTGPVPFPPSFVLKMGRNLLLKDNPGLCRTPQLGSITMLMGLQQCPDVPVTAVPHPRAAHSPGSPSGVASSREVGRMFLACLMALTACLFCSI